MRPCQAEAPALALLAETLPVIGVAYKDKPADTQAFLTQYGNPFSAIGVDRDGRLGLAWGVYGVPESYLIGADSKILLRHAGPIDRRVLDEVLIPAIRDAMRPVYRNFGLILLLAFAVAMDIGGVSGIATPAKAITAEEMLDDPKLESRARNLSKQLRCLVCQNQSIDDSDAELARDLRREVRGQLLEGASDTEIIQTLRGKYGDYLLLNPPISTGTLFCGWPLLQFS